MRKNSFLLVLAFLSNSIVVANPWKRTGCAVNPLLRRYFLQQIQVVRIPVAHATIEHPELPTPAKLMRVIRPGFDGFEATVIRKTTYRFDDPSDIEMINFIAKNTNADELKVTLVEKASEPESLDNLD